MLKTYLKYSAPAILAKSFLNAGKVALDEFYNKRNFIIAISFFWIRFIYGITFFRNKLKVKQPPFEIENNFYTKNKILLKKTVQQLDIDGYSDIYFLKKNCLQEIQDEACQNLEKAEIKYNNLLTKSIDYFNFKNFSNIQEKLDMDDIFMIKSEVNINKTHTLKKILTDDFFLKIAQSYLNTKKITLFPQLFISNLSSNIKNHLQVDTLKNYGAQKYHFDIDFKKFFKIIFYLTDVEDITKGAHIFIPGTHKFKNKKHYITGRFEDVEIENTYKGKKIFIGKAGSFFLVDTFGIHKGSSIETGFRVALICEYGRGHFAHYKNSLLV